MKSILIKPLLIAFMLIGCRVLFAQNGTMLNSASCSLMLEQASAFYDEGHYEQCIQKLENVLSGCKLSRSSKEKAIELLAKSYVEIKDQEKARQAVEGLLKEFPHYELNESENFESYNRLVKKYRVHPLLSVGARNVVIWVGYNTSKVFRLPDGVIGGAPYDGGNYFFSYYGWAEYEFNNDISINGDLMWWTSYFSKSYTVEPNFDLFYSENPVFIEIPVYLKKYFPVKSNLKPYVAGGLGWLYMTKSTGYASRYDRTEKMNYWNDNIDVIGMRNRHNYEWIAGAGLGYKLKNVRLFFDMRYYRGITSLSDPDHRFDNEMLQNEYYYVDSPLKLNKFEMGVSISYTFINSVRRIK
ncbi:MAG: outer membrane beta-barrel protein [Chloroflexota bacterium]